MFQAVVAHGSVGKRHVSKSNVAGSNPTSATAKKKGKLVVSHPMKILGPIKNFTLIAQWKRAVKHRRSSNSTCITSERLMVIAL